MTRALPADNTEEGPLLGDGPIDIGDHHLVVPIPQVDGGLTATRALVLSGHTEHHLIGAILQVQSLLQREGRKCINIPAAPRPTEDPTRYYLCEHVFHPTQFSWRRSSVRFYTPVKPL